MLQEQYRGGQCLNFSKPEFFQTPFFATVMITSAFISLSICSNIFSLFQCYVTSELFV